MSGNAVLKVARTLRDKLAPIAAELLDCELRELPFAENRVATRKDPSHAIPIAELSRTAQQRGVMPFHHGTFEAETGEFDPRSGRGRSVPDCTYGAHSAEIEIEIDEESNEIQILEYVACHDVGRAIDMQHAEGQIQGAVAHGVGYALSEHVETEEGVVNSTLFADHLIPTALDPPRHQGDRLGAVIPERVRSAPVESASHRQVRRPPRASAIPDAIGVRLRELPMTSERVDAAMCEARALAR
jgi:xanthine dehydrogenase molybdenum-binding subunit